MQVTVQPACSHADAVSYGAVQFYGQSLGDPVLFGDISSGKFGTYWVNDGKVRLLGRCCGS